MTEWNTPSGGSSLRLGESTAARTIKIRNSMPFCGPLQVTKDKANPNSVLILTTDSDFYQYIKNANPTQAQVPSAR